MNIERKIKRIAALIWRCFDIFICVLVCAVLHFTGKWMPINHLSPFSSICKIQPNYIREYNWIYVYKFECVLGDNVGVITEHIVYIVLRMRRSLSHVCFLLLFLYIFALFHQDVDEHTSNDPNRLLSASHSNCSVLSAEHLNRHYQSIMAVYCFQHTFTRQVHNVQQISLTSPRWVAVNCMI